MQTYRELPYGTPNPYTPYMTEPESFPVEDARKKFADILDGTQFRSTHTQITRRGKRAGYVVPPEWYDRACEALAEFGTQRDRAEKPNAPKESSPAVAAPRPRVTKALPKPVPGISAKVRELPADRVSWLANKAEELGLEWVAEIRREYPHLQGPDLDYVIVDAGHRKGLRIPELDDPAERSESSEETSG